MEFLDKSDRFGRCVRCVARRGKNQAAYREKSRLIGVVDRLSDLCGSDAFLEAVQNLLTPGFNTEKQRDAA